MMKPPKGRRIRALPVIASCGGCGWCVKSAAMNGGFIVQCALKLQQVEIDSPPPSWCPLRGAP